MCSAFGKGPVGAGVHQIVKLASIGVSNCTDPTLTIRVTVEEFGLVLESVVDGGDGA
jgi:hypothetical protein